MDKNLTIIGGGFASWVLASVFAEQGYYINLFKGKGKTLDLNKYLPMVGLRYLI